MRVAVYHRSVPNNKNQEKTQLLQFFSQSVRAVGDTAIDVQTLDIVPADVAVIQGWITGGDQHRPHLDLRGRVIDSYLAAGKKVVAVDSNLFLWADAANSQHYLRYSFNSVFPDQGIYCDDVIDPQRWPSIQHNLGIEVRPWRSQGRHVLLLLQRNGGWSMARYDVQDWVLDTVHRIRQHTDRPVVIRAHPGDRRAKEYLDKNNAGCRIPWHLGVTMSDHVDLRLDLRNCWAVINHNSSPAVAAAIEGCPVFVTDSQRSQARDIANTDLSLIENPVMPDRQAWLQRLAMSHWNFTELAQGKTWRHMRQWA